MVARSTTPRRTQAPKPAEPRAITGTVISGPDIIRLTARKNPGPETRVVLFSIDGTEYSVPSRPRANLPLKVLDIAQQKGETEAEAYMLKAMLGEDGYRALMDFDDLTPEELAQVLEAAAKIVFGTMEVPT